MMMMIKTANADEKTAANMARMGSAFWFDKDHSCGDYSIRNAVDGVPAMRVCE